MGIFSVDEVRAAENLSNSLSKVLLLGFSVTADSNGYVPVVKNFFASVDNNIKIDFCGVGGVNPLSLTSIFSTVNQQRGPFTHVILEIATSIYGLKLVSPENDGLDVLYDIFWQIQSTGAQLVVVNLYRSNFDYQYHYFDMFIESICNRYQIPLLDLANKLLAEKGEQFCLTLLRDTVHTSDTGSQFQGQAIAEFITSIAENKIKNKKFPRSRYERKALTISDVLFNNSSSVFKRSGLEIGYTVIAENESVILDLPENTTIIGISFLSGPQSGRFSISLGSDRKEISVAAYDEHCFYERYNFQRIVPPVESIKHLTITQLPGRPEVTLRKGDGDTGPRIGKVVALHTLVKVI